MTENGRPLRVAIIGGGASGILALIKLREAGIEDVRIFEKGPQLGGTWYYNRYPGLSCDVPSLAYRYSFAANPRWSQTFAGGPEILAYVNRVVDEAGVRPFIHLNHELQSAEWVDGAWRVETSQGDQGKFDVLISAVGILHHARLPDIEGVGVFAGPEFHTSDWPTDLSLKAKRVGIIGTGSTATQTIIAITPEVSHLSIFMRTPQWMVRTPNLPVSEAQHAAWEADPGLLEAEYQRLKYDQNYKFAAAVVGENDEAWQALDRACREHLESAVIDPELRAKLTPDYPVGCKRLIVGDGFYEAVQEPHVDLVTDKIARIEPGGVRTVDGVLHELDVLVHATGFDTHRFLRPARLIGENGVSLDEAWSNANEAYMNTTVPGFPNFFMIGGPNSPIGNFSWLVTAECQMGYVMQLVERLRFGQARAIAPRAVAAADFNRTVKAQMKKTVWAGGCVSWYMDKNGNVASWPWTWERFEAEMAAPRLEDFEIA